MIWSGTALLTEEMWAMEGEETKSPCFISYTCVNLNNDVIPHWVLCVLSHHPLRNAVLVKC